MKIANRIAFLAAISSVCGTAGAAALTVNVSDSSGRPLADVVVVAETPAGAALPRQARQIEIEQRGLKFLPLVSVIQTGSKIAFPNNDKVKHHIYSFSPAKKFDQKLYSGVAATPQVFDKAGTVVLGCNIHDRMIAYVKVVDSPYFSKTDAAGVARIELPAGAQYTVSAWHFNMTGQAATQALSVKAGEASAELAYKLALKPPVDADTAPSY